MLIPRLDRRRLLEIRERRACVRVALPGMRFQPRFAPPRERLDVFGLGGDDRVAICDGVAPPPELHVRRGAVRPRGDARGVQRERERVRVDGGGVLPRAEEFVALLALAARHPFSLGRARARHRRQRLLRVRRAGDGEVDDVGVLLGSRIREIAERRSRRAAVVEAERARRRLRERRVGRRRRRRIRRAGGGGGFFVGGFFVAGAARDDGRRGDVSDGRDARTRARAHRRGLEVRA